MRVDIFGVKEGGTIDGALTAPLRPEVPTLVPGRRYLLETVIRTMKMGHPFTQGTADSNEIWLDVRVVSGGEVIGRTGGMAPDGEVDPWSHFVNAYVLDRDGKRIDRRNAQDIFVPLYSHQIPPGAADSVHLVLDVPPAASAPVTVEVRLQYRKFDTTYMRHVYGDDYQNELPIITLAEDRLTFPVAGPNAEVSNPPSPIEPEWQRWNDYGIGLLRKGGKSKGELRQAEEAFGAVERLGVYHGPLNLARVYLAQGTVETSAIEALERAAAFEGEAAAPSWSVAWFTGLVNKQNGFLDEAIENFRGIVELDDARTRAAGFDFSQDYRLLNELGQTLFERAKLERGEAGRQRRDELLTEAHGWFQRALELDPENATANYNASLIARQLGDAEAGRRHFELYQKYKTDDNARDRAVAAARASDPAADHAAEAIVFYDLDRSGAYELGGQDGPRRAAPYELHPLTVSSSTAGSPTTGEDADELARRGEAPASAAGAAGLGGGR
jgi:tetratricopeptide (TPR) repeat protein